MPWKRDVRECENKHASTVSRCWMLIQSETLLFWPCCDVCGVDVQEKTSVDAPQTEEQPTATGGGDRHRCNDVHDGSVVERHDAQSSRYYSTC